MNHKLLRWFVLVFVLGAIVGSCWYTSEAQSLMRRAGRKTPAAAPAADSVKYKTSTADNFGAATSAALGPITVGSEDNRVLVAGVITAAVVIDSVKSDLGGHLTLRAATYDTGSTLWTLTNPAAGNHTVTAYYRSSTASTMGILYVYNANQTTPVRDADAIHGTATNLALTLTSSVRDVLVTNIKGYSVSFTHLTGQVELWDRPGVGNGTTGSGSYKLGTGTSVSVADTASGAEALRYVAISIQPVSP